MVSCAPTNSQLLSWTGMTLSHHLAFYLLTHDTMQRRPISLASGYPVASTCYQDHACVARPSHKHDAYENESRARAGLPGFVFVLGASRKRIESIP